MENSVVTLDTARKLKAAGFPQDYEYRWITTPDGTLTPRLQTKEVSKHLTGPDWPTYAAPTAQEIADQLPYFIEGKYLTLQIFATGFTRECQAGYWNASNESGALANGPTMAEALAALYLALQEAK